MCLSPVSLSSLPLPHATVHPRGCSHARPRAHACSRPSQDVAYAAQRMGVYLRCLRQVAGKDWLRAKWGGFSLDSRGYRAPTWQWHFLYKGRNLHLLCTAATKGTYLIGLSAWRKFLGIYFICGFCFEWFCLGVCFIWYSLVYFCPLKMSLMDTVIVKGANWPVTKAPSLDTVIVQS